MYEHIIESFKPPWNIMKVIYMNFSRVFLKNFNFIKKNLYIKQLTNLYVLELIDFHTYILNISEKSLIHKNSVAK